MLFKACQFKSILKMFNRIFLSVSLKDNDQFRSSIRYRKNLISFNVFILKQFCFSTLYLSRFEIDKGITFFLKYILVKRIAQLRGRLFHSNNIICLPKGKLLYASVYDLIVGAHIMLEIVIVDLFLSKKLY